MTDPAIMGTPADAFWHRRHDPRPYADVRRVDVSHQGAPVLLIEAADGTWHRHRMTGAQALHLARRLLNYVGAAP